MLLWRNADKPLISVLYGSSGLWNCCKQAKNSRNQSPALIRQQALPHSGIKKKQKGEQIQIASRPKNRRKDTRDRMETNMRQIRGHSYPNTEESGAGIP